VVDAIEHEQPDNQRLLKRASNLYQFYNTRRQTTDDQRYGKITATTVKKGRLMEMLTESENFYYVPFMNEVYQLHLFKFSAKARGHMQQGLELEGKVLKAYMQTASEELTNLVEKQFVPNNTYKPKQDDPASNPPPYLGASPDGMATDKEGNHVVLEVKCTMTGATLDSLAKQHADQLQMQMHLSGAKEAHLIKCDTSSMNAITSMTVVRSAIACAISAKAKYDWHAAPRPCWCSGILRS
jgi:hypothetical protein